MKIGIRRTSDGWSSKYIIREFNSLEDCIRTLADETSHENEFIVSEVSAYYTEEYPDVAWFVEIYDDYRE